MDPASDPSPPGAAYELASLRRPGRAEAITELDLSFSDEARGLDAALAARLQNLRRLDLTGAELDALPPGLPLLAGLRELRLGLTELSGVQLEAVTLLPALEVLDLQSARLTALPPGLELLGDRLLALDLSATGLEQAPAGLTALTGLRRLDLYGLDPERLPADFDALVRLEDLCLGSSDRTLRALPPAIARLPALRRLRVRGALEELPERFAAAAVLAELDLADNRLDDRAWSSISGLAALRILDLSGNRFRAIPKLIGGLRGLRELSLRRCPLASIDPAVAELTALERLDLGEARLAALPAELAALPALQQLDLGQNLLESLPEDWSACRALRRLDLSDNRLSGCPQSLFELPRLHSLKLTANPFDKSGAARLERFTRELYAADPFAEVAPPRAAHCSPARASEDARPLDGAIVQALRGLGATVEGDGPEALATAAGAARVPAATRQWLAHRWPDTTFAAVLADGRRLWSIDFRASGPIPDFECSYHTPMLAIADYHGGNTLLLVDLADPHPENPSLYHIDHEDSAAPEAQLLGLRLADLVEKLEVEG